LGVAELGPAGTDDDARHLLEVEGRLHGRLQALVAALEAERAGLLHGREQRVLEGGDHRPRPDFLGAQSRSAERRQDENDNETAKRPVEAAANDPRPAAQDIEHARPFYQRCVEEYPAGGSEAATPPPLTWACSATVQTATKRCCR